MSLKERIKETQTFLIIYDFSLVITWLGLYLTSEPFLLIQLSLPHGPTLKSCSLINCDASIHLVAASLWRKDSLDCFFEILPSFSSSVSPLAFYICTNSDLFFHLAGGWNQDGTLRHGLSHLVLLSSTVSSQGFGSSGSGSHSIL